MKLVNKTSFSYEITGGEKIGEIPVYRATYSQGTPIITLIEALHKDFMNASYEKDAVLVFAFGGINVYIDKTQTKEEVFNEYKESYIAREQSWKENWKETNKEEFNKNWQAIQDANFAMRIQNKIDPLFGLKIRVADGRTDVFSILERMQDMVGVDEMEILLKKLDNNNVSAEEIKETFKEDSANNVAELVEKVKSGDSELFKAEETKTVETKVQTAKTEKVEETEDNKGEKAIKPTILNDDKSKTVKGKKEELTDKGAPAPKPPKSREQDDGGMGMIF